MHVAGTQGHLRSPLPLSCSRVPGESPHCSSQQTGWYFRAERGLEHAPRQEGAPYCRSNAWIWESCQTWHHLALLQRSRHRNSSIPQGTHLGRRGRCSARPSGPQIALGPSHSLERGPSKFPTLRPSEHTPSSVPKSRILPEVGDFGKTLHITSPSPPRGSFEIASSPSVQEHRRQQVQESRCYVHSQSQAQGSNLSWPEKIARGVGWLRVARQAAQRQHKEQNQGAKLCQGRGKPAAPP